MDPRLAAKYKDLRIAPPAPVFAQFSGLGRQPFDASAVLGGRAEGAVPAILRSSDSMTLDKEGTTELDFDMPEDESLLEPHVSLKRIMTYLEAPLEDPKNAQLIIVTIPSTASSLLARSIAGLFELSEEIQFFVLDSGSLLGQLGPDFQRYKTLMGQESNDLIVAYSLEQEAAPFEGSRVNDPKEAEKEARARVEQEAVSADASDIPEEIS